VRVGGNYVHDVMPGLILLGIGMGATFVAITIAATSGVSGRESGLASGLLNTAQQIGGALGLAVLTGFASSRTADYLRHATSHNALTPFLGEVHGFQGAFYLGSTFMLGAVVIASLFLKQQKRNAKGEVTEAVLAH
jgi:MFS family permease